MMAMTVKAKVVLSVQIAMVAEVQICRGNETVTEPRMTEPRKTEPRKTERRKTEPRKIEHRKGPTIERLNIEWDRTSNG